MKKNLFIIWLLSQILIACSGNENSADNNYVNNNKIELSFQIDNLVKGSVKSVSDDGSTAERTIDNLYVFLFPTTSSQTIKKYYISSPSFTGGSWSSSDNKILLNITQTEVGSRDVYIVANCTSEMKTSLDGVTTIANLQSVLQTSSTPWSATLTAPILMSGSKTHDFNSDYQLNSISLVRAIAKVQINATLSASHQATPLSAENVAQYKYKFIDFDKNTYLLQQTSKIDNLVSSASWNNWEAAGTVSGYTTNSEGKVISLSLTTYLNERDNSGTLIEFSLPYSGGFLPPPEFGDEIYKLQLPARIERNHWYVIDVEI
ncbi:Major fimbrial subunit protein (FimA) [Bacteroides luti]|uniref:Major fimbrial subunit protein (FimA) n=1 Tax=Bacteroides luti TaxID=1297750 RepID=A0A1M4U6C7_9BACE|nr:fimbrial protein [Bacteroides luti]SHE52391.1 Major fimbrial subunit protein (FimA) [Bacteroides luti]